MNSPRRRSIITGDGFVGEHDFPHGWRFARATLVQFTDQLTDKFQPRIAATAAAAAAASRVSV